MYGAKTKILRNKNIFEKKYKKGKDKNNFFLKIKSMRCLMLIISYSIPLIEFRSFVQSLRLKGAKLCTPISFAR